MKSIKNYLLAVLVLAAILTVVSCKNEDDSIVATYTYSDEVSTEKMIFYNDGTVRLETTWTFEGNEHLGITEGTYTGDLNKNGAVITMEFTKQTVDGEEIEYEPGNGKAIVRDNGKKLDFGEESGVFTRD